MSAGSQIHIYWDAVTAFLFTLFAPTLKSIGLTEYGWMVDKHPFINLALGITDGMHLSNWSEVKEISITHCKFDPGSKSHPFLATKLVVPYMHLPAVTKFTATGLYSAPSDMRTSIKQNHHITDLTLTECFLRGLSFVEFLQSFRALRRLQYQHKTITFPASKIGRRLFYSRDSLEELHVYQWTHPRYSLDFTGEEEPSADEDEGDSDSEANLIGSLKMFTRLK
ncbi:hypothetical protein LZ554_006479 [Drepanopeziza brunnea f. sp. 'monogermtubi']|nr:hypothetical protein LZ554_006479 [Drepanopeziza brunnea f. sp. 'monogermtubi']